jgi:hypothetical protein
MDTSFLDSLCLCLSLILLAPCLRPSDNIVYFFLNCSDFSFQSPTKRDHSHTYELPLIYSYIHTRARKTQTHNRSAFRYMWGHVSDAREEAEDRGEWCAQNGIPTLNVRRKESAISAVSLRTSRKRRSSAILLYQRKNVRCQVLILILMIRFVIERTEMTLTRTWRSAAWWRSSRDRPQIMSCGFHIYSAL